MNRAVRKYVEFHQHDPTKIGSFHADLEIPETAVCVGDAINVMYRSDKRNPSTGADEGWIDYIHEHSSGVKVYRCDPGAHGISRDVPKWLRGVGGLAWLGDCIGFAFQDADGRTVEARGTTPLPELYADPSGRALLVIQGKRRILAMIWGGKLGVEPRGIVN